MSVTFLTGIFPKISETFILNQASGLIDSGCDLNIYASDRPKDEVQHSVIDEYDLSDRTEYIPIPHSPLSGILTVSTSIETLFRHPNEVFESIRRGREGLPRIACLHAFKNRQRTSDIYHAHFGSVGVRWDFIPDLSSSSMVVSFYGFDVALALRDETGAYSQLFDRVDAVTVLSEDMREDLCKAGCPVEKTTIQPIPVDVEEFTFTPPIPPQDGPVRIVTVARFVEKKGIDDALEAVAEVASHYNIRYELIGDGPLHDKIESKIVELGLEDIVTLHGYCSLSQIKDTLHKSHLFLLASKTTSDGMKEGTPTVLLEAQAVGLPVISTYHAGIPEIVSDGKSGVLVPEDDPVALSRALNNLLSNREQWTKMGAAGRKFVEEKHSIPSVTQSLSQIYQKCQ